MNLCQLLNFKKRKRKRGVLGKFSTPTFNLLGFVFVLTQQGEGPDTCIGSVWTTFKLDTWQVARQRWCILAVSIKNECNLNNRHVTSYTCDSNTVHLNQQDRITHGFYQQFQNWSTPVSVTCTSPFTVSAEITHAVRDPGNPFYTQRQVLLLRQWAQFQEPHNFCFKSLISPWTLVSFSMRLSILGG